MPESVIVARTKKQVVSQFRQGDYYRGAKKSLPKNGYVAASVDEIAQRANLAKVTLYVYFGSSPGMLLDRRADIRQAEQQLAALNAQIGG